jgi:hypothetical protein
MTTTSAAVTGLLSVHVEVTMVHTKYFKLLGCNVLVSGG